MYGILRVTNNGAALTVRNRSAELENEFMTVKLNTQSGFLHNEDHGGGTNTEEFDRADEADLFAHKQGLKVKFCSTCFPDNKNALIDEERERLIEENNKRSEGAKPTKATADTAGSPTEFTTDAGTTPPTLVTGTSSNPAT